VVLCEWYVQVFEAARKAGMAIWADEIQTFGRTGELFAFQKLGLAEYMDVVTVGKMLQACMVLFTDEYNPKPGLVSGTFSGSTVALRTGRRTLELLRDQGYLGEGGKIANLSQRFERGLASIPGLGAPVRAIGGMIAFQPGKGSADEVKALHLKLFPLVKALFIAS
jgi:4-aminobutyrate aminotransferase-like enzyme